MAATRFFNSEINEFADFMNKIKSNCQSKLKCLYRHFENIRNQDDLTLNDSESTRFYIILTVFKQPMIRRYVDCGVNIIRLPAITRVTPAIALTDH